MTDDDHPIDIAVLSAGYLRVDAIEDSHVDADALRCGCRPLLRGPVRLRLRRRGRDDKRRDDRGES